MQGEFVFNGGETLGFFSFFFIFSSTTANLGRFVFYGSKTFAPPNEGKRGGDTIARKAGDMTGIGGVVSGTELVDFSFYSSLFSI